MGDEKNNILSTKLEYSFSNALNWVIPLLTFYLVSPLCCETEHCGALLCQAKAAERPGLVISEQSTETRLKGFIFGNQTNVIFNNLKSTDDH